MDISWILFAFLCGLLVKPLGLPPLVGFLGAGFVLNVLGHSSTDTLQLIADSGITLMLFTIGLKLNIQDLIKREVWLGSISHMAVWICVTALIVKGISLLSITYFTELHGIPALALSFALSFSSTVCIVKILEDNGELKTRHGKIALGALVIQDIIAVLFIVVAAGKTPTIYALALVLLPLLKPLFGRMLKWAGHGELLILVGFLFTFGAYQLFDALGVKGDLGALIAGMLLASHDKSTELAKSLLSFKDLFLVGFFLTVGLSALPTLSMFSIALFLCLLLPLKFFLFFGLFTGLRLRARTAFLAGLSLSNFSEFGLIVTAIAISLGWLTADWLIILALSLSFSFVLTSTLYSMAHSNYAKWKLYLKRFERSRRLPEDEIEQPQGAQVIVVGLGRVGKGAHMTLSKLLGDKVYGLDADPIRVKKLKKMGKRVILGDGEDAELWENLNIQSVNLVLLALPSIDDISNITQQLRQANYTGKIAAIARYEDQVQPLIDAGSDKVFNFFTEAGMGFADESMQLILSK